MPATRSSARQAAGAASNSSPSTSQSKETVATTSGTKRKGAPTTTPKAKRGKKGNKKEQATIEETMPQDESQDVEMKDKDEEKPEVTVDNDNGKETTNGEEEPTTSSKKEENVAEEIAATSEGDHNDKKQTDANGVPGTDAVEAKNDSDNKEVSNGDNAVESSSKREESTPSSILEKGIFYFFERGRVGIDEPSKPGEIARSYIVLRPLPHGSKLGDGPIGDGGNNRLLALPKKVLPKSPKDRFMSFVEKANASMDEIKTNFGASDYATKTSGTRHSPPMAPLGEGVYAIISNGRESHLAYILTVPSEIGQVQQDIGLQKRGSFITSIKNPTSRGPANASLPKAAEFPQELLDEFHGRGWMPLKPECLNYANAQFILIGHQDNALEKAADQEPNGEDQGKDKPIEEMEKLEDEDHIRIEHLKGDDSVFVDLELNSQDYPKLQTTW